MIGKNYTGLLVKRCRTKRALRLFCNFLLDDSISTAVLLSFFSKEVLNGEEVDLRFWLIVLRELMVRRMLSKADCTTPIDTMLDFINRESTNLVPQEMALYYLFKSCNYRPFH